MLAGRKILPGRRALESSDRALWSYGVCEMPVCVGTFIYEPRNVKANNVVPEEV